MRDLLSEMEDNIHKYVIIIVTTNLKRSVKFGVFNSERSTKRAIKKKKKKKK